jgi:enolase
MLEIQNIHAREVLDSRGRPTIEVEVTLSGGCLGRAMVPSGASTGRFEALELRDGDPSRHRGLGVLRAVHHINEEIAPALIGRHADDQNAVDAHLIALDGTDNKTRLGANALLGVSLAVVHAAAAGVGLPLWRYLGGVGAQVMPLPMINILSGGLHAARNVDFQDFLIMAVGAQTYSEALLMSLNVHRAVQDVLLEKGLSILKADEGGFGPQLESNRSALDLQMTAIERAGYRPGEDIAIALDVASSHFYDEEHKVYRLDADERTCTADQMIDLLVEWVAQYPILSIEDGLAEDDWLGWQSLTERLGDRVQLLGDDLFTTNLGRLERGISLGAANAILIKMNQIGTLTETLAVVAAAQQAGYRPVVSARSGETEDTTMADLAVATNVGQIKVGSLAQSERLAKYNQLLRIEEALGDRAVFVGGNALRLRVKASKAENS